MAKSEQNPPPRDEAATCANCAWRADCQKKYRYHPGGPLKCPDHTPDAARPRKEPVP